MLVFLAWGICIWDVADCVFSLGYLYLGHC